MPPCDVCSLKSLSVTTATRTLIDLGGVVPRSLLESALDQALRRGLTSTSKLFERLDEIGGRGKAGTSLLRRLVEERSGIHVAESVPETKMLRLLQRAGLPSPRRQYVVQDGEHFVARLDFAYPERRLGIEVDGYRYHSDKRAWQRDLRRANALMRLGWRVPRFTWEQVARRQTEVMSEIRLLWREMPGNRASRG